MCTYYRPDVNYLDRQLDTASDCVFYIYQGKQQQQRLFKDLIASEKEAKDVLSILGLLSYSTCYEVLEQSKKLALKRAGLTEEQVQEKIEERTLTRKNKEYEKSDMIREELYAMGIALMDELKGMTWRPCEPPAPNELPE